MHAETLASIQKRWEWDKGFPATPENISLAIAATGNPFGITVAGKPYLAPYVGMRVKTRLWWRDNGLGVITKLTKHFKSNCDPEARIKMDSGRVVYLHQTALEGYTPEVECLHSNTK